MHIRSITGACDLLKTRKCYRAKFLARLYSMICLIQLVTCQQSTMTIGSTISGPMFLESPGGIFKVNITSLDPLSLVPTYMLAISYAKALDNKIIWVPERLPILNSTNASITLSESGDLEVYDNTSESAKPIWSSNTTGKNVVNATILDTGNLVLFNTSNKVVWQSFDSPIDTLLPNQIFKDGFITTAWKNITNWNFGNYTLVYNSSNIIASWKAPYLWDNPISNNYWPSLESLFNATLTPEGVFQGTDVSGSIIPLGSATNPVKDSLFRLTLDYDGNLRMYSWIQGKMDWTIEWKAIDECNIPGFCGPYSFCKQGDCYCPPSFDFINTNDHRLGCQRQKQPTYSNFVGESIDTFSMEPFVDWPGNDLIHYPNITQASCKKNCLASSICEAFIIPTPYDESIDLPSDCWLKKGVLLMGGNQNTRQAYLRVGASSRQFRNTFKFLVVILSVVVGILAIFCCFCISLFVAQKIKRSQYKGLQDKWLAAKGAMIQFSYQEIQLMTENFAIQIGEGGYGTVFKGQIGQGLTNITVAVKRLNKRLSNHVEKEFMNEVETLGLIHHVHLVSLLGYCINTKCMVLVYEYVPKGSLDRILFRDEKNFRVPTLEWNSRFDIALQTARGLTYLHEDCKKWIIHCDVKPENILLDSSYCVKVADFGLSRIQSRDQMTKTRSKTMNIRGTFGYLAPEYWLSDHVSISNKVDVFSYGMVLLEIISGRRNILRAPSNFKFVDNRMDTPFFPVWAFPKLETNAFMDVLDPTMTMGVDLEGVRRALRVAFWCIAEKPQQRPSMSEVVQMLQGRMAIKLPVPRPEYFDTLEFEDNEGDCSRSEESMIELSAISSST